MTEDGKISSQWSRRSFLKGVGLGALALTGVASPTPLTRPSWAAAKPSRFVYAWTAFDILDPHVKYDLNATFFTLNMYDSLLRYQCNPPEIVPWLAERDEPEDGGRRWTFHLRRGVQFHDGSEVDAEAVRYSFERLLALGKGPSGVFRRMGLTTEGVRVIDPYTVEFNLAEPFGPFRVAIPIVSIVNPTVLKSAPMAPGIPRASAFTRGKPIPPRTSSQLDTAFPGRRRCTARPYEAAGLFGQRLMTMIPTLIGLVILTFFLARVVPADPVALIAGEGATREQIDALRQRYGFDLPL